ncbi:MAG TPA: preprotein translocase subunit SecA [Acidobacteriota bacterium]|nr:preprotein translocase subunit SecA [Acidobacteriota bacterium]
MINTFLAKIIGSQNERFLKRVKPTVVQINSLEKGISNLSDAQLRAKTAEFKQRIEQGETLDDLLPEAFAAVREASMRTLGMRHYDVQLIGGIVLHSGKIAEMKTGEGKTLVATLATYLNALAGKGVHLVTANDYLARRDAEWMGPIYEFLGMKVGSIQHEMTDAERQVAYQSDITYGTNNEFGFDYLRDNMKYSLQDCTQRHHTYAIVDEVDSILIDEARTPLIISGPSEESTDKYYRIDKLIPRLVREEDFNVDEKARSVVLQEPGIEKAEKSLGIENLYDPRNMDLVHHIQQALKAHTLFTRDQDYVVKENQVIIVDEFTGRLMPGRRYSDGLHQALEAKEGVKIERENQTLATITFQNYFRMYDKLAGMTGTAETEAAEFEGTYKLQVVVIPTNQALIRTEFSDVIYRTQREKFSAVADEIKELNQAGRPVLVGTTSIEKSERLSSLLKRRGIKHVVLNAKYHEKEAQIVAEAGEKSAVTIATNMAGRGTDIILGGKPEVEINDFEKAEHPATDGSDSGSKQETPNPEEAASSTVSEPARQRAFEKWKRTHDEVVELGGLHIIGTERHEARRIDNQLRGRAGRQGDPGSSRFYLSLEDDLLRIFGSENITNLMQKLGMEEGVPIESRLITRQIERAQGQVEARNFEIRKHLLEYDDVMNKQREEIYRFRRDLLEGEDQKAYIFEMAEELILDFLDSYASTEVSPADWDFPNLNVNLKRIFGLEIPNQVKVPAAEGAESPEPASQGPIPLAEVSRPELEDYLIAATRQKYEEKEQESSPEFMRWFERMLMLQIFDQQWKDHLLALDHLKEGIGLRGYGQRDPKIEYKRESFALFEDLRDRVREEVVRMLFLLRPASEGEEREVLGAKARRAQRDISLSGGELESGVSPAGFQSPQASRRAEGGGGAGPAKTVIRATPKVGRNDPCPCGSGKKFKKCCGR